MILLLLVTQSIASGKEKRLLLHSEADMATELIRLRSELANVTQQLGNALVEINSLTSTQSSIYQQFGTSRAEIKSLKSNQSSLNQQLGAALAEIKLLKSTYSSNNCKFCFNTFFLVVSFNRNQKQRKFLYR
jgi:chromosome segregation ATPase